jgi:hypothetical protein
MINGGERVWLVLLSGISTTIGQNLLLYLVWSTWMQANGLWVLLSLLLCNCGAAGLLLRLEQS